MEPEIPKFHLRTFLRPLYSTSAAAAESIDDFLRRYAQLEDYKVHDMPIWSIVLRTDGADAIPLYTVEEEVHQEPGCEFEYCRRAGIVSKKYHFIIPAENNWDRKLDEASLDAERHLLRGLITETGRGCLLTVNGFTPLLCENGSAGRSKVVSSRELISLWNRICAALQACTFTPTSVDYSPRNVFSVWYMYTLQRLFDTDQQLIKKFYMWVDWVAKQEGGSLHDERKSVVLTVLERVFNTNTDLLHRIRWFVRFRYCSSFDERLFNSKVAITCMQRSKVNVLMVFADYMVEQDLHQLYTTFQQVLLSLGNKKVEYEPMNALCHKIEDVLEELHGLQQVVSLPEQQHQYWDDVQTLIENATRSSLGGTPLA